MPRNGVHFTLRWSHHIFVLILLASFGVAAGQGVPERYDLKQMTGDGQVVLVKGVPINWAEITFTFIAQSKTDKEAHIPLRLDECIILDRKFSGDAQQSLSDQGVGGYHWSLLGKSKECKLVLTVLAPLKYVAGETQLQFTAPQAQQALSKLELLVPGDMATGQVLGAEQPREPVKKGNGTLFTFHRLSGQFTFSWHPRGRLMRKAKKLRASVLINSSYDSEIGQFFSSARIRVWSFGGKFSKFQVRLPPGAVLAEDGTDSKYEFDEKSNVVTFRDDPATERKVFLTVRSQYELGSKVAVQLAGFQVIEAIRWHGYLSLDVEDNLKALWSFPSQHVKQIDKSDWSVHTKEIVSSDTRAVFKLLSSAASLTASCSPAKPRVRVESEYVVIVEKDQLRLEAAFKYAVDRVPCGRRLASQRSRPRRNRSVV